MLRNRHAHYQTLKLEECCCHGMKVPRIALLPLTASAFVKLFWEGDNPALICITGFDHGSFCTILEMYTPVINHVTVDQDSGCIHFKDQRKGGQHCNLNAAVLLALLLAWI